MRATPLGVLLGVAANSGALDICRQARLSLTDADAAASKSAELTDILSEAQATYAAAVSDLATQDAQICQLAEAFALNIPTATLHELRSAVTQGKIAIDLRAAIAKGSATLIARLGVATREAAEAALATQPLQDAEAVLATLSDETDLLTRAIETAIEARTKAQAALDQVQGDADVAKRVAQQRTIEIEMQEGSLRYLEDRFAHLLAERALRRYRDTHRGGMLVATETAFRTLTNGAYASLSTQAEGQSEALVAIQSVGGSSKQAREMSKGTKFQLYLALRAAAYEQVAAGGTILPFFCDDIFETFDESRTTAACGLLRQIGQTGQAIYLTHHKHVVGIARNLCGDDVRVHELSG
jgi:DNA repair exonuclease SbcCD ATPase subunit